MTDCTKLFKTMGGRDGLNLYIDQAVGYVDEASCMKTQLYRTLEGIFKQRVDDGNRMVAVASKLSQGTEDSVAYDLSNAFLNEVLQEAFAHGGRLKDMQITPYLREVNRNVHETGLDIQLRISVRDGSVYVTEDYDWKHINEYDRDERHEDEVYGTEGEDA